MQNSNPARRKSEDPRLPDANHCRLALAKTGKKGQRMLEVEQRDDMQVVRVVVDRIDAASAIQFKDQMRELACGEGKRVILDLSGVGFIDSSGLGAVVAVLKLLAPERRLELAGLTPNVQKVFRLTRMDGIFLIHPAVPNDAQDAM